MSNAEILEPTEASVLVHASYRKRVLVRAIVATVLLIAVVCLMWWIIDTMVDNVIVPVLRDASTSFSMEKIILIKMVIRGIVYFGLLIAGMAQSLYTRNNPDTLLMSMGAASKKVLQAAISEDLRREELRERLREEQRKAQGGLLGKKK